MKKIFPLLTLMVASAHAAPLPLISNTATHHLPDSKACIDLRVVSVDSDDPALNRFTDRLLEKEIAEKFGFDQAGLKKWLAAGELTKLPEGVTELRPEELSPGKSPCRPYEISLVQTGEGEHYRSLYRMESANNGGAHSFDRARHIVMAKTAPFAALKLEDITLAGQEQQLEKIQRRAFRRQLRTEENYSAAELEEAIKNGLYFNYSVEDWWPTKDGLVFDFTDNSRLGHELLTVPAVELKEVIKPEFLAELARWQEIEPERDESKNQEYKATPKPNWRDARDSK
mgnify:CR=1 FL=1